MQPVRVRPSIRKSRRGSVERKKEGSNERQFVTRSLSVEKIAFATFRSGGREGGLNRVRPRVFQGEKRKCISGCVCPSITISRFSPTDDCPTFFFCSLLRRSKDWIEGRRGENIYNERRQDLFRHCFLLLWITGWSVYFRAFEYFTGRLYEVSWILVFEPCTCSTGKTSCGKMNEKNIREVIRKIYNDRHDRCD